MLWPCPWQGSWLTRLLSSLCRADSGISVDVRKRPFDSWFVVSVCWKSGLSSCLLRATCSEVWKSRGVSLSSEATSLKTAGVENYYWCLSSWRPGVDCTWWRFRNFRRFSRLGAADAHLASFRNGVVCWANSPYDLLLVRNRFIFLAFIFGLSFSPYSVNSLLLAVVGLLLLFISVVAARYWDMCLCNSEWLLGVLLPMRY